MPKSKFKRTSPIATLLKDFQAKNNILRWGVYNGELPISLSEFVRESWNVIEASPLDWNWHIEAICLHCEALLIDWLKAKNDEKFVQRMQNLLINVPPGSMKSRIVSVCLPAWFWLVDPSWKAIFLAANPRVALRDSVLCKEIIKSDWYQKRFSPKWKIKRDRDSKSDYGNTAGGFRKSFGLLSKITGDRADFLGIDDPHDAQEIYSDTIRESVLERYDSAIANRVNDLRISVRLGIMQRLKEDDWAGHVYESGQWVKLSIPQEYTGNDKPTAIGWIDPRVKIGELMFPKRFPNSVLYAEKERLGAYGYSGQHQQEPSPMGGGMFPLNKWRIYIPEHARYSRTILSMDTTFKSGKNNDYMVIGAVRQRMDITPPQRNHNAPNGVFRRHRYYVPGRDRMKAGIEESQEALLRYAKIYPHADVKLIEDKANGPAIIQQLKSEIRGLTPFNPGTDSKTARAHSIKPIHSRGDICLPCADWAIADLKKMGVQDCTIEEYWAYFPPASEIAEHSPLPDWGKDMVDEFAKFPNGKFDDQVDFLVQALIWLEAQSIASSGVGSSQVVYG